MKVVLLHDAEIEFWESVDYYEVQYSGLGIRFKEEVDRFLEKIQADPFLPSATVIESPSSGLADCNDSGPASWYAPGV